VGGTLGVYRAIYIFFPVNANLRWLNNVSCLFLALLLIMEYSCASIKV
jgi:hypothetical protein